MSRSVQRQRVLPALLAPSSSIPRVLDDDEPEAFDPVSYARARSEWRAAQLPMDPPRTIADVRHDLVSVGRCPECAMVVNRAPSRATGWIVVPDDHLAEAVEEMGFLLGRQVGDARLHARRAEQTRIEVVHVLVHLLAWALFDDAAPPRTLYRAGQLVLFKDE